MDNIDPGEFYNRQQNTDAATSDYSSYVDKSFPFKWVLINKGNKNLQIRSKSPCFRVLGLFKSKEEATRHCKKFEENVMDIYLYETNTFIPITLERNVSPDEEKLIVEKTTEMYKQRKLSNTRTFEDNVKNKKMGKIPDSVLALMDRKNNDKGEEREVDEIETDTSYRLEVCSTHELRGQRFIVWSYMEDNEVGEEPEQPIVRFHAVLEDEATAVHQSKFISQTVTDVNIVVSPMYEWIHINAEILNDNRIPSEYRNQKLDEIMKRKAASKQQVESYISNCNERNVTPTYKDLFDPDMGKPCVDDRALHE